MKIVNVVGARPQFIKYFPVMTAIRRHSEMTGHAIGETLVHTGQHYDYGMSRVFFESLGLKEPDYHLEVGSRTHGAQTAAIMERLEPILQDNAPDIVVVFGDTNSTLAAALAASKLHIPVAHIEAGLRSFRKRMPEEVNRVVTDHVSTWLFCPSAAAIANLRQEGFENIWHDGELLPAGTPVNGVLTADIDRPAVCNVGDVMFDVQKHALQQTEQGSAVLQRLGVEGLEYNLITIHRAESTDFRAKLAELIAFVNDICAGRTAILPMHPRTRKVYQHAGVAFDANIQIVEPVDYFEMVTLMEHSKMILTDSGGMQKEAYWLRVPCVTLRDETEWVETVAGGWNVLYKNFTGSHRPVDDECLSYGDGDAADRIVKILAGR